MQFIETTKNNISDNYYRDSYSKIIGNFADEYEMKLNDIQKLMTYKLYKGVVKDSNHNKENIIKNSFKLIIKRLFLSDYDTFQPTGKITI